MLSPYVILMCYICHKVYSEEWILRCVHGVKILNVLYLMQTKPLVLKICG